MAGPIDVVVNNIGVPCIGAIEELPIDALRAAMDVNSSGHVAGLPGVIPTHAPPGPRADRQYQLLDRRRGLAALWRLLRHQIRPGGRQRSLLLELAPFGIAVRLLQPGLIATAFGGKRQAQAPSAASPYADRLDRPEPEDLAQLVSAADHVAAVLQAMIEAPEGAFRVTCGEDSRRWIAARRTLDDSDFFAALERGGYAFR